jgi:NAD(P)-dependent dehydrogenase (short-subunit alcohol dehydrogenase family)
MPRLAGKVALITGAGSGIGRATAQLFAREGATVVAVDKNGDGAKSTADTIRAIGGTADAIAADAGSEADVAAFVDQAVAKHRALDVTFANAGIAGGWIRTTEQTVEQWTEVLRVNLIGPFLAIKHASRVMAPRGRGSIICTASVAGLKANAGSSHYAASKAGVISLVQTSAYSLAGSGIRVNAVCPGIIETGMTKPTFEKARARGTFDALSEINPLKRIGQPQEIAAMVLFLASDEASYVNGQAIPVDGGLTASMPYANQRR